MLETMPFTILAGTSRSHVEQTARAVLEKNEDLVALVPSARKPNKRARVPAGWLTTKPRLARWGEGCACCTVRADVASRTRKVLAEGTAAHGLLLLQPGDDLDVLVKTFSVSDERGRVLSDEATIRRLVVTVEVGELLQLTAATCKHIELADEVIVLLGSGCASDEVESALEVVRALCPSSAIHVVSDLGDLDLDWEVSEIFDLERARQRMWQIGESASLHRTVFSTSRPFHPSRLYDLMREDWPEIYRVHGLFWVASRPAHAGSMDVAGDQHATRSGGMWWAAVPPEQRPASPAFRKFTESWHPAFGDRKQELLIAGRRAAVATLEEKLRACLLTDEELEAVEQWEQLPHPFSWPEG